MAVLHGSTQRGKEMSTVMDVEENFVPVNSREDIEKVMTNSEQKKKEKYFKRLFKFLGGGDSPLEAVELALGRDSTLKETQLTVLSIFSLWVDEIDCFTKIGIGKRKMLLTFLSDCNIVKLIIRLISLKRVQSNGKETFSKYLYYHCMNILAHITDGRYIESGLERVKNMKVIRAYYAVPKLVDFLDPLNSDPLLIYQTSKVLKHLAKDKRDMCVQIYKADGLRKCLHFMLRKEADKMFADYLKEYFSSKLSMPSDEVEILEKFHIGTKHVLKRIERYPPNIGCDRRRDCFTYMAAHLQDNCALIAFEMMANPKISKPEILKSKLFTKVLNKWFSTPCIWRTERTMLQGCFHLLRCVLNDDKPALTSEKFLESYHDILGLIKQHIYNPDQEVLSSVISLLSELSMQYPELRKKFIESPLYSKLLPVYIESFDVQVQVWALQALVSFVKNRAGAKHVLSIGVTAEKLYLLTEYTSVHTIDMIRSLKTEIERYCPERWERSEKIFQSSMSPQKHSLERAQKYKEEGNLRFKAEDFESALKCYTLGLQSLPPVEHFTLNAECHRDQNFRPWYVLPSVLFTNRAQCYISMNKWQEAIDDCTAAIVRSYEDKEEARKILFKTVYRRARAFSELKNYRNALNDISFCLRLNPAASNVRSFFREVLTAYRKEFGIEPLRRCGTCMEGVGMKLKRCAKCPEMYCSRDCQTYAWEEEGHKLLCNYTLDEDSSE